MSRVSSLAFLLLLNVVLFTLPARAAESGGEAGGHADVIQIDPFILGFTLIVFLAVLFFLKRTAWGPLLTALEERERKIEEARVAAEESIAAADQVSRQHEAVLAEARADATGIVEASKRKAEEIAGGIRDDAKAEAEKVKDQALAEIHSSHERAIEEIHERSVELALEISQKLVGKSVNPEEHRGLIDEVIRRRESKAS